MADVRDWGHFIRSRWDWERFGYEKGFPRGCGFTDQDASLEFDGFSLCIEPKHFDGAGYLPDMDVGQRLFLRDEAKRGKTVFVLYGCATCNDPYAIRYIGVDRDADVFVDWRGKPREERRALLKEAIDTAMGLR